MSTDIKKADSTLAEFWPKLKSWYDARHPGRYLFLVCVDRTPPQQLSLFCKGRLPDVKGDIVTYKDGYNALSKHNYAPSKAIDVGVLEHGVTMWADSYFEDLGQALLELDYMGEITWGGVWKFKDLGHFEVK